MPSQGSKTRRESRVRGEPQSRGAVFALGMVLVAATFAAHFPAVFAGYIWDDDVFLYKSPLILAPGGLYKIWFTAQASDYWPLMSTMFWIEWRIWGNNPMPYHVANIALHAVAAMLVWRVLRRLNMNGPGAFLAGLIFAVHPVTVESVAWIAERKNVLSIGLYLLAISAYLCFEDCGSRRWYVFALVAGAAALLAKTSAVMLPLVLLLCVWWRRGRLTGGDILRMLPFLVLSLVLGLVEVWFVHQQAVKCEVGRPLGFASRIAASGWIVWFYLYKIFLPINLAMIYPRWDIDGRRVISFVPLALLIGWFAVLWRYRATWGRAPLAAMGYFVITLFPVLGFFYMSLSNFTLAADHLQYASMVGVIALASGLLASLLFRAGVPVWGMTRGLGLIVVCGLILTLGTLTWRQACFFEDEESLWTHTLQLNPRALVAYYNRGAAYDKKGNRDQAIRDYTKAIELKPDYAHAYYNRGVAYDGKGNRDQAIRDYTKAIELKPDFAEAYNNRGNACGQTGNHNQAIRDYTRAIELEPDYAQAYNNRGNAYREKGNLDQAIRDYAKAIELKPDYAHAYRNRGVAYDEKGDRDQAIRDYTKAIALNPDLAEVYNDRGLAYGERGDYDRAIRDYTKAIEFKPDYAEAYNNRGVACGRNGDYQQKVRDCSKAIELKPDFAAAYNSRATAYFFLKQYDKAWADVEKCRYFGGTPPPDFVRELSKATERTE